MIADDSRSRRSGQAPGAGEERFRTLMYESTDGIAVVDADNRLLYESRNVERITGYKTGDWTGRRVAEWLIHPEDRPLVASFAQMVEAKSNACIEGVKVRFKHRDGTWHVLEITVRNLLHDPSISGIVFNFHDITERLRAQQALSASEQRFRTIFERSPIGSIVYDSDGMPLDVNQACMDIFGISREDVIGGPSLFHYPDLTDEAKQRLRSGKAIRAEVPVDPETVVRLGLCSGIRSGRLSVRLIVAPLDTGADGSPKGYLGLVEDVTRRLQAQEQLLRAHADLEVRVEQRTAQLKEANEHLLEEIRQREHVQSRLQESEARYRELVESANSIIMELDTSGRVTFFNRFAQEFYGFSDTEIMGRRVVGTIAPAIDSEGNDVGAQARALVRDPEGHSVLETEGMRRNGEPVWISWTNKGLRDAEGRLRNILCIGMDRTEQRRVAGVLARELKEKAATEERQRLARDLHDAVSQTLFSASLIADILPGLWVEDRAEGERRLEELCRMTRGALAEMRVLLLELRPGALGRVGLTELLHQLVKATRANARLQVSLTVRGECDVPADVQVTLYRVAQEALNNVVKHSGATEVDICLRFRQGAVDLTISDNGSGFEPGEVSPNSLGLRIMQERVEAVHAGLTIEACVGHGTKVRAVWPATRRKEHR